MEYRVFRNPDVKIGDGRRKPFGQRDGFIETAVERLTAGRVVKALLLGAALGAFALLVVQNL